MNDLDCAWCGELFGDFGPLAAHVRSVHLVSRRSAPDASTRKQAHQEPHHMAKQSKKKGNNPAFITAEDISAKGRTKAKITRSVSVFHNNEGRTSLFIGITVSGETFTLGVRCGSPDRIALQNVLGRNIIDWPGQTIELYRSEGSQGGTFVNVFDPKRNRD